MHIFINKLILMYHFLFESDCVCKNMHMQFCYILTIFYQVNVLKYVKRLYKYRYGVNWETQEGNANEGTFEKWKWASMQ